MTTASNNKWEFWIDRGGTFTDIIARKPDGSLTSCKLLSENPDQYADAAIQGIRDLLDITQEETLPVEKIAAVKMGTTVATNALLERQGEDTLLVITQGFADALRIAYQNRPDLFSLNIQLPSMLYKQVIEIEERIDAQGKILIDLNLDKAKQNLQTAFDSGLNSIAIVLMHGYRYQGHEKQLAGLASDIGFTQISVSHQSSPLIKLVSRGDTTVVDAYLTPILQRYIQQVSTSLAGMIDHGGQLTFMQSNGGLTDASLFQGKDAILSGPAGGIVGMVRSAKMAGFNKIIGFDMGGTSTDVSHYATDKHNEKSTAFETTFETEVAGVRIRAPMLLIHTVAAGGGSILKFDGARYRVGPESAGAFPGPCAYRNNGPLTITDCNVLLGKLQPQMFPSVFGDDATQTLDVTTVQQQFELLAEKISQQNKLQSNLQNKKETSPETVASGFLKIAIENMANAIKKISVQRGYDVTEYVLCCFGGAGGQHACLVADALGIKQVFVHPFAGVLSAYGMGLADTLATRQQAIGEILQDKLLDSLDGIAKKLQKRCEKELSQQGISATKTKASWVIQVCYQGSDTTLPCDFNRNISKIRSSYEILHKQRFGFIASEKALIIESIQVDVTAVAKPAKLPPVKSNRKPANAIAEYPVYFDNRWQNTPFYQRDSLTPEQTIKGPAIIIETTGTTVIEIGWQASLNSTSDLILKRDKAVFLATTAAITTSSSTITKKTEAKVIEVDPVKLEIFNQLFMSIAEQMGYVLANTAVSVNIKERLDFSCAIFDAQGALVANAPHMPVHLGSMGESIKSVIRDSTHLTQGDVMILNAPYNGGTHLPDITLVKPVFSDFESERDKSDILFYVASRGHHADIGGKTPGSAPADSTHIDQEGIVINNFKLVKQGVFQEQSIRELLASGKYPARNIDTNIADFKAQLAACEKGAQELEKIVTHYGLHVVQAYMQHIQDNAEESVRRVLETLQDGEFSYEMDNRQIICVAIKVDQKNRQACIDFSGTSPQHRGNYNAPLAITKAAVLYVFRCLVDDDIPLNEGCLKPLEIIVPERSLINPEYPAAVIAGNVETSQYIVDTLFGALKTMAASQGTMNNFFFGNDDYQYYETLCGGAGATATQGGADAVHTHMTNSRLTDPEVLEQRFPVILEEFKIRKNSGGSGRFHGGNGVIRKMRFLEPMTATLLTGHRNVPPYGMQGGKPGKTGKNLLKRANGEVESLGTTVEISLQKNDIVMIKTPGGGGFGKQ